MSDIVERLRTWADMGDMGRGPDPSDMRRQAAAHIEALERKVDVARVALEFYANNNQPLPNDGPWGVYSNDFGNCARQALKELEND